MSQQNSDQLDAANLLRVLDVSRQLTAPLDLDQLLTLVIDVGREALSADRGTVFLYDEQRRELYSQVATGEKELRFSVDAGSIAGDCVRSQQIDNVADCYADPRFNRDIDRQTGYRTRCLITVPLIGLEDQLVGVMQLLNPKKPQFDSVDERIAEALAGQAAVAIQRARLIEDRLAKMKLEADLDIARQIQLNVLPTHLPPCPGYELAHFSEPADQTGGDIYDVVRLGGGANGDDATAAPLVIFLADATGHGIGPALSVTQARAMLRIALRYSDDLDTLFAHINSQLTADLASNRFITAFLGVLDPSRHSVQYHAPGQGPLLHFHAQSGRCQWLNASTVPMGIMDAPPMDRPDPIVMAPGDLLVLLTDGFYEYQDMAEQQFGRERIGEVISQCYNVPADTIVDRLVRETRRFAGGAPQLDDLTAVIIKRLV